MTRDLDQGGVQRDVVKIAKNLDPERFEPHVGTFIVGGIREQELRDAGIPILHLPVGAILSKSGFAGARQLARYIRKHSIQVLHAYDPTATLGVPVGRWLNLPVVLSSQLSYRDIMDWKTKRLMRWTDPFVDAVVVNCEAMRRHMMESEGFTAERVELCYNGLDTEQFYPAEEPKPDEVAGVPVVIGAVCALRPEKGLTVLQEAFARVHQPRLTKLLMVGSGDELPRLIENARKLGIMDASVFVPATPAVARWLRAIDIFALPSLSEAFSNSLLEAMACGCSVVGSRVGGTPELTGENEERGLLFPSQNVAELAKQLGRLIENKSLRRELGSRASKYVRENLTIEAAARRTGEIYNRKLARD